MKPIIALGLFFLLLEGCATVQSDYSKAQKDDTVASYKMFLSKHVGDHSESADAARANAKRRIAELQWKQAQKEDSVTEYKAFLAEYRDHNSDFANQAKTQANRRIRELKWEEAVAINTPEEYQRFEREYLSYGRTSEAVDKLTEHWWKRLNERYACVIRFNTKRTDFTKAGDAKSQECGSSPEDLAELIVVFRSQLPNSRYDEQANEALTQLQEIVFREKLAKSGIVDFHVSVTREPQTILNVSTAIENGRPMIITRKVSLRAKKTESFVIAHWDLLPPKKIVLDGHSIDYATLLGGEGAGTKSYLRSDEKGSWLPIGAFGLFFEEHEQAYYEHLFTVKPAELKNYSLHFMGFEFPISKGINY